VHKVSCIYVCGCVFVHKVSWVAEQGVDVGRRQGAASEVECREGTQGRSEEGMQSGRDDRMRSRAARRTRCVPTVGAPLECTRLKDAFEGHARKF